MDVIKRLDLHEKLAMRGFSTFKLRHTGRYDMEITNFDKPSFAFLREKAPWLPLVQALLGPDAVLQHTGVMLSMPGSKTQPWHSDGDHISKKRNLPPHCLNVFVPLVRLTTENGGTEMAPRTQHLGHYDDKTHTTTALAAAGECIIFDFRLRHRGLGNRSNRPRPLLYLTYCIPSFRDTMNFNKRRYLKLPELASLPTQRNSVGRTGSSYAAYGFDHTSDDDEPAQQAAKESSEERIAKRVRAARAHHRSMAAKSLKNSTGISLYPGAPVLALDSSHGWFPAKIVEVHQDDPNMQLIIHFNGWHKRFDFLCDAESDRLRPCAVDLVASGAHGKVESLKDRSGKVAQRKT